MGKKNFLKTREGGLLAAFIGLLAGFVVIMAGLSIPSDKVCLMGFLMIAAAMLYSPFRVFVLKGNRK